MSEVDNRMFGGEVSGLTRWQVASVMADYADRMLRDRDVRVGNIAKHMVGLFQGMPGARAFRRHLSENAFMAGATGQVIRDAAALVPNVTAVAA